MSSGILLIALISCIIGSNGQFQPNPIKSTTITPNSDSSGDGISVQLLNGYIIDNEWRLSPTNNIGFDMKLSFDNTWGFRNPTLAHSNSIFNITFNNNPLFTNADDFIIALSVNDSKYIASIISLNNDHDNILYPSCRDNFGQPNALGNIQSIMAKSSDPRLDKILNYENVTEEMYMKDQLDATRIMDNEWPLQFEWRSLPDFGDFLFHKYYGNSEDEYRQTCYILRFQRDKIWPYDMEFDILLAVDYPGNTVAITSIEVSYKFDLTYAPTMEPTTAQPTHPTMNPTTMHPTVDPTMMVAYTKNITVQVHLKTKVNVTISGNITRSIVEIIETQLKAVYDGYLISTIVSVENNNDDDYTIIVKIQIGGNNEIDLENDIIDEILLENDIEEKYDVDIIAIDVTVEDKAHSEHNSSTFMMVIIVVGSLLLCCILTLVYCIWRKRSKEDEAEMNHIVTHEVNSISKIHMVASSAFDDNKANEPNTDYNKDVDMYQAHNITKGNISKVQKDVIDANSDEVVHTAGNEEADSVDQNMNGEGMNDDDNGSERKSYAMAKANNFIGAEHDAPVDTQQ